MMPANSAHIDEILTKHNRTSNIQVVFIDIEKYSKRRSLTQIAVIDNFTSCLRDALIETSKEYIGYAQTNSINFQRDIISLPTGDGAAIVFSFDGLHDIHLFFAKALLKSINLTNKKQLCDKFGDQGWCNCHSNFFVRIGISEGKGILYRDINDNYNVAGEVINLASRVMGLFDRNQIGFTETAFRQIVDMIDDPALVDRFIEYKKVEVKHGLQMNVYQYIGAGEEFINGHTPYLLGIYQRIDAAKNTVEALGFPLRENSASEDSGEKLARLFEGMSSMLSGLSVPSPTKQVGPLSVAEEKPTPPSE